MIRELYKAVSSVYDSEERGGSKADKVCRMGNGVIQEAYD